MGVKAELSELFMKANYTQKPNKKIIFAFHLDLDFFRFDKIYSRINKCTAFYKD